MLNTWLHERRRDMGGERGYAKEVQNRWLRLQDCEVKWSWLWRIVHVPGRRYLPTPACLRVGLNSKLEVNILRNYYETVLPRFYSSRVALELCSWVSIEQWLIRTDFSTFSSSLLCALLITALSLVVLKECLTMILAREQNAIKSLLSIGFSIGCSNP